MPLTPTSDPLTDRAALRHILVTSHAMLSQDLSRFDHDKLLAMQVYCLTHLALSLERLASIMSEEWQR